MIELPRAGGRLLDVATLVVAFPLSAAGYAQASGRPWAPAVHVTVSAIALMLALLWVASATRHRIHAHGSHLALVARLLLTLALMTLALLNIPAMRTVHADEWVLSCAVALAMITIARLGWRAVASGSDWVGGRIREVAPAAVRAGGAPVRLGRDEQRTLPGVVAGRGRHAAKKRSVPARSGIAALRARMDEVTYAAGTPNVLTMTKLAVGGDGHDDAPGVPAAAEAAQRQGTFSRADREGETVLALGGVLDVVSVSDFQRLVDAVVAERCASVVLDARALRMVDSAGVSAVVGLVRRAREFGGVVRVSGLRDQPLEVFRLLRLDLLFELPARTRQS